MTGAVAALAGTNVVVSGSGGSPGAVSWTPMYGTDSVASNTQTLSGFTGVITVSAALSGGGTLYYGQNSVQSLYSGAFAVHPGDEIYWVIAVGHMDRAGTLTVTNATASATIQAIPYSIITSWDGSGNR